MALFVFELSKIFLVGSPGGISSPALTITCCAIDFRDDMPSGSFDMRPLAVEGIGELAFTGEGLLLSEECGEAGGTGVGISVSLLL